MEGKGIGQVEGLRVLLSYTRVTTQGAWLACFRGPESEVNGTDFLLRNHQQNFNRIWEVVMERWVEKTVKREEPKVMLRFELE